MSHVELALIKVTGEDSKNISREARNVKFRKLGCLQLQGFHIVGTGSWL